ncbi:hypothetical protein [Pseudonocardia sp. NPDC046786]|uniref:hypothetical protein n=1 Tax=Pseudonocardia sp. NPDC046786 TaxID=3155471 RepID=UPI0033FB73FD
MAGQHDLRDRAPFQALRIGAPGGDAVADVLAGERADPGRLQRGDTVLQGLDLLDLVDQLRLGAA